MIEKTSNGELAARVAESRSLESALQLAVRDALIQHKCAGHPICVWRDGKVVWIPAEEIQIDDAPNGEGGSQS